MAHYLVVTGDNPNHVTQVEGDSLRKAIESLDLADGESCVVYRILAEPRVVTVKEETVRKVQIS